MRDVVRLHTLRSSVVSTTSRCDGNLVALLDAELLQKTDLLVRDILFLSQSVDKHLITGLWVSKVEVTIGIRIYAVSYDTGKDIVNAGIYRFLQELGDRAFEKSLALFTYLCYSNGT